MHFVLISGSQRPNGQTRRVVDYVEGRLKALPDATTHLVDLAWQRLPLWDSRDWSADPVWTAISAELRKADGFVVATPEWSGMASPALKNFFLFCSGGELAHKPGLIVAVSASSGGAYPVAELRMSSCKNTHLCYLPDHIIVRRAAQMLAGTEPATAEDRRLRERIDYSLRLLDSYAAALRAVRAAGVIDLKTYAYGM